jgi:hypothetical protein
VVWLYSAHMVGMKISTCVNCDNCENLRKYCSHIIRCAVTPHQVCCNSHPCAVTPIHCAGGYSTVDGSRWVKINARNTAGRCGNIFWQQKSLHN